LLQSLKQLQPVSQKSSYHHGDLRQALIDGAIAIITARDVDSVSLREVARQAGVSHTAPYRHFADKEGLLAAVAEEGFKGLSHALNATLKTKPAHPTLELELCGIAYVEYAIAHPSHYRVMFGAHRGEVDRFPELAQASAAAFGILVNLLSEGQVAGALRSGNPDQLAKVVWSMMHGLVMLLLDGQIKTEAVGDVTELVKFMTRSLLEGLIQS
jgi:AcrR family transcriptional regulator